MQEREATHYYGEVTRTKRHFVAKKKESLVAKLSNIVTGRLIEYLQFPRL